MKYTKASKIEDYKYIAGLYNPKNNRYLVTKKVSWKNLMRDQNQQSYIIQREAQKGHAVSSMKIGFFGIMLNKFDQKKGRFVMIIDKPYQNKGFGKDVMKEIIKRAKKHGIKELSLGVFPENIYALKLYLKNDFKKTYAILYMHKKI